MRLRIYLSVFAALLLAAPAASGSEPGANTFVQGQQLPAPRTLTRAEAVAAVKGTGGYVQSCRRLAPRHFECWARYWFEITEEEGVTVVSRDHFAITWRVDVGLRGARVHET